ncbi:Z1 domain-containing protein [Streptomyces decoyicus]|uniref:Z1 domain-containing protein n=1 Tax=Streptomyces decoyicus TaxID=249567 RepID=UPI00362FF06C
MTDQNSGEALLRVHRAALDGMSRTGPMALGPTLSFYGMQLAPDADVSEPAFRDALPGSHRPDPLLQLWHKQLTQWDFDAEASWTDTEPRTDSRRAAVHKLLGLEAETCKALDALIPVSTLAGPVVISQEFTPWRATKAYQGHDWYWPKYAGHLAAKGWPDDAVADLGEAAERVVERLADPTAEAAYQSKGLVVGYVQSGKTANFTGVIAKAVDAGYRLVIVLGGTLNLLRAQTQRRLDMELVGRENILRHTEEVHSDYYTDNAWLEEKFLSHGGRPSTLGAFDIIRLTTRADDYQPLAQGIGELAIEKQDSSRRLYDPVNLHSSAARLMVVKKNKSVLTKLVNDLKRVGGLLDEIPVLIIDDESDEASVNTTSPKKPGAERTAINAAIAQLLQLLPRAQYVGYTATPFANVFIDPSDKADIFPRDFIISLDRPHGYMGVQDFHDLDSDVPPEERNVANSQEKAHVRDIGTDLIGDDAEDTSLREAVDMFVLTAAMKLYRETKELGYGYYRHHTMLVHESRLTADHRELLNRLRRLWLTGGYAGPTGHARLRDLFERDLLPVSRVRADGFAVPASYDDLVPYVGTAWQNIGGDDRPVIVVNGDQDIERGEADFDGSRIWKILIGGQKLSRGFTVEGLTVTYYRRRAGNASTLMQMGRWFGFRKGYQDLVRLYIGRNEASGKSKEMDLYEAFEAICRDEEIFRDQLRQYSVMIDGYPQVTPADVPPLVSQHLLKPTSPNKMYNTRRVLAEICSPGKWEEPAAYPATAQDIRTNTRLWTPVLDSLSPASTTFSHPDPKTGRIHQFAALTGLLPAEDVMAVLRSLKWCADHQFAPYRAYLEGITKSPSQVDDWLVIAPQHASGGERARIGASGRELSWFSRHRRRAPLFGAISEPKHRPAALRIAGTLPSCGHAATDRFAAERRGVIALYPVVEPQHAVDVAKTGLLEVDKTVIAFSFVAPSSAHRVGRKVVHFTTIDSSRQGDPNGT